MAGTLQIKHGAKMRVAYDAPVGQEPELNFLKVSFSAILGGFWHFSRLHFNT